MTRRRANPVNPAGQLSGGGLRDLARQVRGQGNVFGGGVEVGRTAGGLYLSRPMPPRLRAELTALTGNAYSWTQQIEGATPPPIFTDDPDGLSGTDTFFPAYEVQNTHVVVPSIADLRLSRFGDWYLFKRCCPAPGFTGIVCDACPGVDMPTTIYGSGFGWDPTCWSTGGPPPCTDAPPDPFAFTWRPTEGLWRGIWHTGCAGFTWHLNMTLSCAGGRIALAATCDSAFDGGDFGNENNAGACGIGCPGSGLPSALPLTVVTCSPFLATLATPINGFCCSTVSVGVITFSA
jgi:hypothetical protein